MVRSLKVFFIVNPKPPVDRRQFFQDKLTGKISYSYLSETSHNEVAKDIYLAEDTDPDTSDWWCITRDGSKVLDSIPETKESAYKLIASTNQDYRLISIPVEFIHRFVNADGKVDEVLVMWEELPGEWLTELEECPWCPAISRPIKNGHNTLVLPE